MDVYSSYSDANYKKRTLWFIEDRLRTCATTLSEVNINSTDNLYMIYYPQQLIYDLLSTQFWSGYATATIHVYECVPQPILARASEYTI